MKKTLLWLLVIAISISIVATFSLAGCKEAADETAEVTEGTAVEEETISENEETEELEEPAEEREPVELKIMMISDSPIEAYTEIVFDTFEEKYPWISINLQVVGTNDIDQAKLAAFQAGSEGADIIEEWGGPQIISAIDNGGYLDLSELEVVNRFDKELLIEGIAAGPEGIYGVPTSNAIVVLGYNMEMFDELGLELPQNLEEFYNVCDELVAEGITPMSIGGRDQWPYAWLLFGMHASMVADKNIDFWIEASTTGDIQPFLDEDGYRQAFEEIKLWFDKGYIDPASASYSVDDSVNDFVTGKNPLMPGSTAWLAGYVFDKDPDFPLGITLLPVFTKDQDPSVCSYFDLFWCVNAQTERSEEVELFLDHYYDNTLKILEKTGRIPGIQLEITPESIVEINELTGRGIELAKGAKAYTLPTAYYPSTDLDWETFVVCAGIMAGAIDMEDGLTQLEDLYESKYPDIFK